MRAAWTKWVDDMVFTQSMMQTDGGPAGNMATIVPCIFEKGSCRGDPRVPRSHKRQDVVKADVAWGSVLPLLGAYTAELTGDARFAARVGVGAANYVALLHTFANNASFNSAFPGLLNTTAWNGHLGDWCPAVGSSGTSTLLNSHHLILDIDAAVALLNRSAVGRGGVVAAGIPHVADLVRWASTARASFSKAFLHNITVPGASSTTCATVPERTSAVLSCNGGLGATIEQITFAGYGVANGSCATQFRPDFKCYTDVSSAVAAACVGKPTCTVECYAARTSSGPERLCAGVNFSDPCAGVAKTLSVSIACSTAPTSPSPSPAPNHQRTAGLAYHDPYPPGETVQPQTEAAAGLAAMDAASTSIVDEPNRVILADTLAALVVNHNRTTARTQKVTYTGGVIDMSHLAPELIKHGHPDVAFDLLASDGYPSYYNMAKYGGTLWENWANANGCDTPAGCDNTNVQATGKGVGSLNHIMYGGSVGSAVFGIGGIQPFPIGDGSPYRTSVAPVPWLPDAPYGSAVWRSLAGVTAAAWAAHAGAGGVGRGSTANDQGWHVWVNVTVAATGSAHIKVMMPQSAQPSSVCAWECGSTAPTFTSEWVSFDAGGGHLQLQAVAPSASAADAPAPSSLLATCRPIWRSGAAAKSTVVGIDSIAWEAARPGYTMFPALTLGATSGAYAVFAKQC